MAIRATFLKYNFCLCFQNFTMHSVLVRVLEAAVSRCVSGWYLLLYIEQRINVCRKLVLSRKVYKQR
jgi:hypothetical protein